MCGGVRAVVLWMNWSVSPLLWCVESSLKVREGVVVAIGRGDIVRRECYGGCSVSMIGGHAGPNCRWWAVASHIAGMVMKISVGDFR